ncbi:MAG: hypothetical protein AB2L13_10615 [Spirochaetota bacterium]
MATRAEVEAAKMEPTLVRYLRIVKYPQHLRGAPPMEREIERRDAARLAKQGKVEIVEES